MIGRRRPDDAQAFEDAWAGRAPRDEHIADLVHTVEQWCAAAAAVEPSDDFRSTLRTRLLVEAETVLIPVDRNERDEVVTKVRAHPARRRVAALATAVLASAGVVGLVTSSAGAVPGDMLYPVKRSVESVQLTLHRDDASRGSFQLKQAAERLAEARELSAGDSSRSGRLVAETLDDFTRQAGDGSAALFDDYTSDGDETSIRKVTDFAAAATVTLSNLSGQLPAGADASFQSAAEAITGLATTASSLCTSCVSADVRQLVDAVTALAKTEPTANVPDAHDKPTSDAGSKDQPSQPAGTGSGATPAPTLAVPLPSASAPPSLGTITDPLLGALLGDDEQEGLVPGVLDGLLGPKK